MSGMRRRGIPRESINAVRKVYKLLFETEDRPFAERREQVAAEFGDDPCVAKIVAFLRAAKRPVMLNRLRGSSSDQPE